MAKKKISCRLLYEKLVKKPDIAALPKSLGFESGYDVQQNMHHVRHIINARDVENVVKWLFDQGFDVVR